MRPFAVTISVLLALVLAINGAAMWDRARRDDRMRVAAARLGPGDAVVFEGILDERRFQEARVEVIPRPRLVVFGSSRAREVSAALAGAAPGNFYNLAMSAATVEDYVALWSMLKRRGAVPDIAVFSVDAWVLSRTHDPVPWPALAPEVARFAESGGAGGALRPVFQALLYRWYRAKDLLSYSVLAESVRDLRRGISGRRRRGDDLLAALSTAIVSEDEIAGRQAVRADGSFAPAASAEQPDRIRNEVVRRVHGDPYGLANFEWDPGRAALLERLWRDMRLARVSLVIYMPPYHPAAWELLSEDPRYAPTLRSTAAFLSRLAISVGGRFVNASDPGSIPCPEAEFRDVQHPVPSCLARLWARLRPLDRASR